MKEYTPDYVKCCQFDHYCKLVLYHEAIDYLREMQRYRKYQISLEDISLAQWDKFSTRDEYPQRQLCVLGLWLCPTYPG